MKGTLYICATPIGNLSDITLRCLETLKSVDIIAAEDTRHTAKLLNAYEIKKSVTSYYEHNKIMKSGKIIGMLLEGKNVALVSDAGTPIISDPGDMLLNECIENGIEVVPLPGPCAAICALTVSGLNAKRFTFVGFLPPKTNDRKRELEALASLDSTLVFYEAPHKIKASLKDMLEVLGNRRVTLHREMTKKFEQVLRLDLESAVKYFNENEPKGEFVIITEGAEKNAVAADFGMTVEEHVASYVKSGMDKKEAIRQCAKDRNIPKREVYNLINGNKE